jgi:thimet oligopeptidase
MKRFAFFVLFMILSDKIIFAENPVLTFKHTPEEIQSLCEKEKGELGKNIESIGSTPLGKVTLENTLLRLETVTTNFSNSLTPVMFLKYVSPDEKVRAAADVCETSVSQLLVDIFAREDLYNVVKAVPQANLEADEEKLLDEYLTNFRRNGLELTPEKRKEYVEKKKKLVVLESEFSNNLVNEKEVLLLSRAELDGVPESLVNSLEKTPEGLYKLTMAYPHYYPFMQNATNGEARKKFENKFNNRGGDKNRALLEQAISLRDELAKLLGFQTHSAFVLERRMAKTPEEVRSFLTDLAKRLKPKGEENIRELLEAKKADPKAIDPSTIYAHDWRFYENILRKTKYNVDNQKIKEYFPLQVVVDGMFEIYQSILSVKFVEDTDAEVWHSSVKKYRIERKGKVIAHFYMDLFPREGKYSHAAAFTLRSGYLLEDGKYQMPISSIVANFNPPTPENASLLEHSEVETLFHEFGHIMHQTLTRAKYTTFSGTNVKTDFVEAPSQMLENWVWNKESLVKLSGHYKDPSQKLPDDLIQKLLKAKNLDIGIQYLRQLAFATIDLDYHTQAKVNSTQIYRDRMKEIMLIPIGEGTQPQASFGHLMGGYDSGYYGYLWSEVYAQDMFTRFSKEGMLNPSTGADYLKWILQPGGAKDPFELITSFLGRKPNNEAFLKSLGL